MVLCFRGVLTGAAAESMPGIEGGKKKKRRKKEKKVFNVCACVRLRVSVCLRKKGCVPLCVCA